MCLNNTFTGSRTDPVAAMEISPSLSVRLQSNLIPAQPSARPSLKAKNPLMLYLQENVFSRVRRTIWVILHGFDQEHLPGRFHEVQICSPPFLEAEIANCPWSNQILQCLPQKRESWFEIHAVCRKDDIRMIRDSWWTLLSPIVDVSFYPAVQVVQGDVLLHKREHWFLIGDVQFSTRSAPHGYSEPMTEMSQ